MYNDNKLTSQWFEIIIKTNFLNYLCFSFNNGNFKMRCFVGLVLELLLFVFKISVLTDFHKMFYG